jgi:hypothetical protein
MSNNLKWYFPSTGYGDEDGISDPLRETFEGDHERFVARESIQNSLDARLNYDKPVKVVFERFMLPVNKIPGITELKDVLNKALDYYDIHSKASEFYKEALAYLDQPTVPVLKISDFNTFGLNGDDQDKNGGWYKLIRASGVNTLQGVGGGSFGIGKGAPFAASALRTVFYSTINEHGQNAFQGKARLSSFKDDSGDVRRGIGQFGLKDDRGVLSIRDRDLIPDFMVRSERGTDIYILGYKTLEQDWRKLLLNSLLNNFWAAVHFGDLVVELTEDGVEPTTVSQDNLDELMAEYAAGDDDSYNFYKAVIEPTKDIHIALPLLGEVSLYVKVHEGYPKAVQLMRRSKMVVDTIRRYRVLPDPYAAVFICNSDEGNVLLRDLEPPTHDKWDPNRNKEQGKAIDKELREFIKDSLRSMRDEKDVKPEDIPDLNKYLPAIEDRDDLNAYYGDAGEPTDNQTDSETGKEIGATKDDSSKITNIIKQREVAVVQGFERGEGPPRTGTKDTKNKTHTDTVDPTTPGQLQRINTAFISFRAREMRKDNQRVYQTVITSEEKQSGSLKIMAIGDDGDYPVDIAEVKDENGNNIEFKEAYLSKLEFEANKPQKVFIRLRNQKRYALGVETYER